MFEPEDLIDNTASAFPTSITGTNAADVRGASPYGEWSASFIKTLRPNTNIGSPFLP